ncbi:hypothetical protein P8452_11219 [Trifolium repens]|nr:hypothetical protein P8452_11219 [Trifolium repens]
MIIYDVVETHFVKFEFSRLDFELDFEIVEPSIGLEFGCDELRSQSRIERRVSSQLNSRSFRNYLEPLPKQPWLSSFTLPSKTKMLTRL